MHGFVCERAGSASPARPATVCRRDLRPGARTRWRINTSRSRIVASSVACYSRSATSVPASLQRRPVEDRCATASVDSRHWGLNRVAQHHTAGLQPWTWMPTRLRAGRGRTRLRTPCEAWGGSASCPKPCLHPLLAVLAEVRVYRGAVCGCGPGHNCAAAAPQPTPPEADADWACGTTCRSCSSAPHAECEPMSGLCLPEPRRHPSRKVLHLPYGGRQPDSSPNARVNGSCCAAIFNGPPPK